MHGLWDGGTGHHCGGQKLYDWCYKRQSSDALSDGDRDGDRRYLWLAELTGTGVVTGDYISAGPEPEARSPRRRSGPTLRRRSA